MRINMSFTQLSMYFAMLEQLLAIGTAAAHAVANADPSSPHLAAAVAHLDAFNTTAQSLAPVVTETAQAVQQVIKPPQV
jgi:hypothetical protein